MPQSRFTIIVSGMLGGHPGQGGAAWAVLQYVLGLLRLGHDVYLIEPISRDAIQPCGNSLQSSQNAAYFLDVTRDFELEGRCSLLLDGSTETIGVPYADLQRIAKKATALVNISGMLWRDDLISDIPTRIYLDLDPAFNQLWHATQGIDRHLSLHNRFVTVGKAIGTPDCSIPTCGVQWITTFQPIVLDYWPAGDRIKYDGLTTVANWRGYGSIQNDGVFYGQKAHSLRAFIDLPTKTSEKFILALAIHAEERTDLDALSRNGWELLDPAQCVATPYQYQQFVSTSKAEFGIAKSGYVVSRSAWFSDRSVCYLAAGRPVIAQDTGFSSYLPCGTGLLSFCNEEEALAAIERLNENYAVHAQAARSLAIEYFDSRTVLSRLLTLVGL